MAAETVLTARTQRKEYRRLDCSIDKLLLTTGSTIYARLCAYRRDNYF
jgi:hypothetical protein